MTGFKLGAILFPLMILSMILRQKGLARKFMDAGAVSEETARRPGSIEASSADLLHLKDLVRRGVLRKLNDGRYYVDRRVLRRRRWVRVGIFLGAAAVIIAGVLIFWPQNDGSD